MSPNLILAIQKPVIVTDPLYAQWFANRTDSLLEALFGVGFCEAYMANVHGWRLVEHSITLHPGYLCFIEPFCHSGSNNGSSIAYLTAQEANNGYLWDFGIYVGADNGAAFEECSLRYLIEIDGYSVHRKQRKWDVTKMPTGGLTVIRVHEEFYKSIGEAADDVLQNTIFFTEDPTPTKLTITHA